MRYNATNTVLWISIASYECATAGKEENPPFQDLYSVLFEECSRFDRRIYAHVIYFDKELMRDAFNTGGARRNKVEPNIVTIESWMVLL